MKKIILTFVLLISSLVQSQEIINTLDINDFEIDDVRYFDTYNIKKDSSLVSIFLIKNDLFAYNYELTSTAFGKPFVYEKLKNKYGQIVGHAPHKNGHTLFLNSYNEKWFYLYFNFNDQNVSLEQFDLRLKSEVILNSFSNDHSHYILTIKKNSSTLILHKLNTDGTQESNYYDFSSIDFSEGLRSISNLYQFIKAGAGTFQTDIISQDYPMSMRSSNDKVKIYRKNGTLIITVDNSTNFTYILELNKEKEKTSYKIISKNSLNEESSFTDSNSFLFENNLFIIKSSFKEINFSIVNLTNSQKIGTYKTKDIFFNNVQLISKNKRNKNQQEIISRKEYLKEIVNSKPAIYVERSGDNYTASIGSLKGDSGEYRMECITVPTGLGFGATIRKIPKSNTFDNDFLDFSRIERVYSKMVLDPSFNHISEAREESGLLKRIRNYLNTNNYNGLEVLNIINREFYLSRINPDTKRLEIRVFKN
jgi:hypothetical protein